jgi:SSS family solute:Na+ symporter
MAATAASFSGWTFIGHPGLIWRDGLAYAFASFYVLTIPITGTFFSKRTWLLGKRYGFITPGDMYAYYYNTEACAGWSC